MADRVTDGLWCFDCRTFDQPNAFLVDGDGLTLVDAGWPGDHETVREGVRDAGFELGDVDRVLLTHYDADHVGGLARLPEIDAPVYVHEDDAGFVRGDETPPWTARNGIEALHRLYYRRLDRSALDVRELRDGDEIAGFRAVHTPGHTPGHLAYVHDDCGAVFLGDLAYALGDRLKASGRFASYAVGRVPDSVRSLLGPASGLDYACPGHGPVLDSPRKRLRELLGD